MWLPVDPQSHLSLRKRELFLQAYGETGNISKAARAVDLNPRTIYRWREGDEDFAVAMQEVADWYCDNLESALYERGVGWTEDGKLRYDTTAAIAYLNANRPDKYRRDTKSQPDDTAAQVAEGTVRGALAFLNEAPVAGTEDSSEGAGET